MRLPIPIFTSNRVHKNIEIIEPSGAVIADTIKVADSGDIFSAIKTFIAGCVSSVDDIIDKAIIKTLVPKMPYRSAETVAIKIMTEYYGDDDGIEGIYYCPRCRTPIISEYKEEDGMVLDSRDFVRSLGIGYKEDDINEIIVELENPVVIKNALNDQVLEKIEKFVLIYPTVENCINAYKKVGLNDIVRLQYAMYVEALKTVNDEVPDQRWKNALGMPMFEGIKNAKKDIGKIAQEIKKYGINPSVKKTCLKCGKVWFPEVNTTNFFVSALRQD